MSEVIFYASFGFLSFVICGYISVNILSDFKNNKSKRETTKEVLNLILPAVIIGTVLGGILIGYILK